MTTAKEDGFPPVRQGTGGFFCGEKQLPGCLKKTGKSSTMGV